MKPVKISHFFTEFYSLGGVQNVLRHHRDKDAEWQIKSNFIIYSESEKEPFPNVNFLGVHNNGTIAAGRNKLKRIVSHFIPDVAVYHGMWGLANLGDLDRAARRILLLHGETPGLKDFIQNHWTLVDGIICVSQPLQRLVQSYLPEMSKERIALVDYPISPPDLQVTRQPLQGRRLRIGFCSRIQFEQKRVDRLPELCELLDKAGVDYQLELLGDGTERAWLEEKFKGRSNIIFHGRQNGLSYWKMISEWDLILFVSDYEGLPIALLEALALGVVPIYPEIGSGGDQYVAKISPNLVFKAGDLSGAARAIKETAQLSPEAIEQLRCRCREIVTPHVGNAYMTRFSSFVEQITTTPRVSKNQFPSRRFYIDYCPYKLLLKARYVLGKLRPSQ